MDMTKFMRCPDFIALNIAIWLGQRILNPAWVQQLKQDQYSFMVKHGSPKF